ncbi:MAG TPA: response regulator, partial [Myxococcales bacterium]|nr:response regulator [Myxococcales bacterium]
MTKPLILAIDDAFDGIDAVRTSAHERGCEVTLCTSARDGFDGAIKYRPIVILLSADIPNGLATCNRFKSDTNFKDIPLVLMTSQEKDEVFAVHRELSTHADHYLKKPLSSADIERCILSLLPE